MLRTSDGGSSWQRLTCSGNGVPLAIDATGNMVVAQVGEQLYVSSNGGTTWNIGKSTG